MSQKRCMHPRNIYNNPPDFKQLAVKFPEFKKHATVDLAGKLHLSFKDPEAVRAYSRVLLQKDFDLDVIIPPQSLVPTIPLRLNYILWIEDLLSLGGIYDDATGIDIGTGASCVYPLMIARKNRWSIIATEVDSRNLTCARDNVTRNGLNHLITVQFVTGDKILAEILDSNTKEYDFCMCNPPFFGGVHELSSITKARKKDRPPPRNAFSSSTVEVVTEGGEVEFITKLIEESTQYKRRIKIFSTMIGIKRSLKPLKRAILDSGITSFKQTEFFQGHTTRWGLAWTFASLNLAKVPDYNWERKKRQPKMFTHTFEGCMNTVDEIDQKLQDIFLELEIKFSVLRKGEFFIGYNVIAYSDTWSHNRRKRREQVRLERAPGNQTNEPLPDHTSDIPLSNEDLQGTMHSHVDLAINANMNEGNEPGSSTEAKRKWEERECDGDEPKRIKTDLEQNRTEKYLEATVYVKHVDQSVFVELSWITGTAEKDTLHQILQYIVNHLKLNAC